MSEVHLVPWEAPENAVLVTTQVEEQWQGRTSRFEVCLVRRAKGEYWICLREYVEGQRRCFDWVVAGRNDRLYGWTLIPSARKLKRIAVLAIRGKELLLVRSFVAFGGRGEAWEVSATTRGTGTCFTNYDFAVFRFPTVSNPVPQALTFEEIGEQIQGQWQKPNSDLQFAAKWLQFSWEQRCLQLYPNYREIQAVMRWMLQCVELTQAEAGVYRWTLIPFKPKQLSLFDSATRSYVREVTPQFLQWQELLHAKIAAFRREDLLVQHQCAARFQEHKFFSIFYAALNSVPTAHERLEAALELREWLEANGYEGNALISR